MSISGQVLDEAGRKRHLEALFADEPYLSPTMKARRIHEKIQDARPALGQSEWHPAPSLAGEPHLGGGLSVQMSFDEARRRLSGQGVPDPFGFSPSDPLSYFRTQVLSKWIQKVDRRENE